MVIERLRTSGDRNGWTVGDDKNRKTKIPFVTGIDRKMNPAPAVTDRSG